MIHKCTYIMWPEGTNVSEAFFRAMMPTQARDNFLVTEKPADAVRSIAEKLGQKGLVIEPGEFRR